MNKTNERVEALLDDAIYCVRSQLGQVACEKCRIYPGNYDFCDGINEIILAALEEVKQYREIGTLEECREAAERWRG